MPQTATERLVRPPMEGAREAPFFMRATSADEPNDGLTLDGYGAVFNRLAVIDSWEGRFREMIAMKSMQRSFRETPPKIQFDHGRHPVIGSWPIAELLSVSEDVDPERAPDGGAHVIARIFDRWYTEPIRDGISAGAIDGMSFRFSVIRESWTYADGKPIRDEQALMAELQRCMYEDVPDDELPIRTLKELRVPEMGPVVWPAYEETSVALRSKVIDLGRLDDPEQRKLLARAVFMVDAAQSQDDTAQRDTAEEAVVEHPADSDDAQRSTPPSVGERPSKPRHLSDMELRLRNQRSRLLNLRSIGDRPL